MNDLDLINEELFECVEDALQHAMVKRTPPEELIRRIRFRYPYPVFFIESSEYMLRQTGLSNAEAFYFWMIPGVARRTAREAFGEKPRLNTLSRMAEYLKALFIGVHVECFYAILLDSRGGLIRTEMIGKGTVDSAPFDMGRMLALLVDHSAKAVVMCHNHPCGTMQPSTEDLRCTLDALAATATISVPLLDHIIIAKNRAVSIRDSGYIAADLWMMQGAGKKLVRDWVDVDLFV